LADASYPARRFTSGRRKELRGRSARRRRSIKMRRISVEVSSGTARFRVSIQAKTIERALEIAHRQNSGKQYKVIFPMAAEVFSAKEESTARVGALGMAA
jgi:hypothetical protein